MKLCSTLLGLMLLWGLGASPALGATRLESARAASSNARQTVSSTRSQQTALRRELNQLAGRIEALKARSEGKLLQDPELEASLRRSQELSASLTQLAQTLSFAEAEVERQNLSLLEALSAELEQLRTRLTRGESRQAQRSVITQMKSLRSEREQVRASLPAAAVPNLGPVASEDPEELMEQADALRDNQDKLALQMRTLQSRITDAREERELDRRMDDFLADESLFDEQDRRLRLRREENRELVVERAPPLRAGSEVSITAAPPQSDAVAAPSAGASGSPESTAAPAPNASGTPGRAADPSSLASPDPTPTLGTPRASSETTVHRASDSRPQLGAVGGPGALGDDLESLEAQLEQLRRLHQQFGIEADQLQVKARSLE